MNRTFDRLVNFDERSREYPIRTMIRSLAKPRSYTWRCNVYLDQGNEGKCAGYAVSHEAAARPCEVKNVTNKVADAIYARAQKIDEWPGEAYSGTSVLAAMKAGQERGWYESYRWAFGLDDVVLTVGFKGPCVLGTKWYEGMSNPDKDGIVKPTGRVSGGHAYIIRGVNVKARLFRIRNSWGKAWGADGDCFISFADMDKLLKEDGEACVPIIRRGA
jgi:hypothetical protein